MKLEDIRHVELEKPKSYEKDLLKLQYRALEIQRAYARQKRRAMIVFEGSDAAGKGGTIRRLAEKLDPRSYRVHRIAAPNPEEQAKHYLHRFWRRVPPPGRIEVFDRSWYGRVLVERVEKFAPKEAWKRAYAEINEFERTLAAEGVRFIKIYLYITKEEQLERFRKRYENPLKRWKLTVEDFRNRDKWGKYSEAAEDMVERCSEVAPWHVIGANHKKATRIKVLELIDDTLSAGVDISPPPLQPGVAEMAEELWGE